MSQNVYQFIDVQRVDPAKKPIKAFGQELLGYVGQEITVSTTSGEDYEHRLFPGGVLFRSDSGRRPPRPARRQRDNSIACSCRECAYHCDYAAHSLE